MAGTFLLHSAPLPEAGFLLLTGGYYEPANGCPAWGSSDPRLARFIGDEMGRLVLNYTDGTAERIPLVFGYTLWFHSVWAEPVCAPFKTASGAASSEWLRRALFLKGAFEGDESCTLCVRLPKKSLCAISVESDPVKEGAPLFDGFSLCEEAPDPFFATHTVEGEDIPAAVLEALSQINLILLTPADGFPEHPAPAENCGLSVDFQGQNAAIFNGIFHANAANLMRRTDPDGFVHTSYAGAPSWRYDGFGPWIPGAGTYYRDFYARDSARALMTLLHLGRVQDCLRAVDYAQKCLMFFPEKGLKMLGKPVPGHFTMVINDPLFFHEQLTKVGWPTKHTPERFGSDYANLGNLETDGHGLMMMAIFRTFQNAPDRADFAKKNLPYIREAAEYIRWSLENPEISFAENGLLCGDGEAAHGTAGYSLYCNIPCLLGLQGYAEIAETAGDAEAAARIRQTADALRGAITKELSANGQWRISEFGYYHDCAVTFLSDLLGYDTADMPQDWVALSRATYEADISRSRHLLFDASGGLGYNTAMRLQNALLLDQTADFRRYTRELLHLCYAPGLPEPYLVPECASYSPRLHALRRQGDLANLVQMAEVLKCLLIVLGISPLQNGTLKILPRLCENTGFTVKDFPIANTRANVSVQAESPRNGAQKIRVRLQNDGSVRRVLVRFGPFTAEEAAKPETLRLALNDAPVPAIPFRSGDAWWCRADWAPEKSR